MLVALAVFAVAASMLAGPGAGSAFAEVPSNNSPPEVAQEPGNRGQTPKVGEHIICYPGSWVGGVSKFTYQWLREGVVIAEAEGQSNGGIYTITAADEGNELWCNVIATNPSGSEEEESENGLYIPGESNKPPKNEKPPEIQGTPAVGNTLKCTQGVWSGSPTPAYSYQWLRDGGPIALQTTNEYTVVTADEGNSLSCKVTATNGVGTPASATSESVQVSAAKLKLEEPPSISGYTEPKKGEQVAVLGSELTCSTGKWSGNPTFAYKWLREGTTTVGEASAYRVVAADQRHGLSCEVIANANKEMLQATSSTVRVLGEKPANTKAPTISGTLKVNHPLTCQKGQWTGVPAPEAYKYVWVAHRGTHDEEIIGVGTNETYTVHPEDQGNGLTCEVTAENVEGKATAVSAEVVIPAEKGGEAPKYTQEPKLEGPSEREVGATLKCNPGAWTGTEPITLTIQWLREGVPIGEGGTYFLAPKQGEEPHNIEDEGHNISCQVIAVNEEGSAPPFETGSVYIKGRKPKNEAPPRIEGEPVVNETLTCSRGQWSGLPTPTYTYYWLRNGSRFTQGETYKVKTADSGYSLACEVTAENREGIASTISEALAIPGSEPKPETPPRIESGTALAVGETAKCVNGKWSAAPTPTYSYQWLLNEREIHAATGETYVVASSDQGRWLSCRVTATNTEGSEWAESKGVKVPGESPIVAEEPYIEGNGLVGETLTCKRGQWEGAPPPVFTYKWLLNGAPVNSSNNSEIYTPEASQVGQQLSCDVIAANTEGTSEAASSNSVVIAAAPSKPGPHQLVEQPAKKPAQSVDPYKSGSVATAAEIRSGLSTQLTHVQHTARIASLLKHGDLSFRFASLGAGKLEVLWYEVPKGAHVASAKAKPKPALVASATESYASASTKTVTLHLTKTGRRLLARRTRITLTAEGVFVRSGASAVHWYRTFVLVR
ncbi:MAG TPA: hypothetical protein VMB51_01345 [Solirubrobacteraceae bacterium]|nr:hypothetical protein [Solirubrobacteraceae bacterium]